MNPIVYIQINLINTLTIYVQLIWLVNLIINQGVFENSPRGRGGGNIKRGKRY